MKKYLWILAVVVIGFGAYIFLKNGNSEAQLRDVTNFAISDIEAVDQIKMKNRQGDEVILKKIDNKWYVNGDQLAFEPKVNQFLNKTLAKIRIKGPVQKSARENVIRSMVGDSKHIVIYSDNEVIRDYYVGRAVQNQKGSYIHLKGSDVPYIAHILGLIGVIGPQFSCKSEDWLNRTIFDYAPEEITQIEVENNEIPSESFVLNREDSIFQISPPIAGFTQSAARSYFSLFKFKNFEGFAPYLKQSSKDSIKQTKPFMRITLILKTGDQKSINIYRKTSQDGDNTLTDKKGHTIVEDTERYFATFSGFDRLVTIQEYTFGKLITKRSFFGMQVPI